MNNSNTHLFAALSAAPNEAIPKSNTKAYHLLLWLIDGKEYDRNKLILDPLLGESMRSALQDLRSDKLLNWLIHSSVCEVSAQLSSALSYNRSLTAHSKALGR
ncbi:MAG: hypothetical protein ACJAW1_003743 [Glaciecola sp.]|jgi:hypothetical protein